VPASLPDIRGHWTIAFVQRLVKKDDGSLIPGTSKDIGVLSVDIKDGANVVNGNHANCTQSGNVFSLNSMMLLDKDGKPGEACFTSVGSFDGSRGQLSNTEAVLATAGYEMEQPRQPSQSWRDVVGEAEKLSSSAMVRSVSLKIEFDNDSYRSTKISMFDGDANVSNNTMAGTWCDDAQHQQNCGTLFGQRTSDHGTNPVTTGVPQPTDAPALPLSTGDELLVRKQNTWAKEYIDNLAHTSGRSVITSSAGSEEVGFLEHSASGEFVEPCKLRVTLRSTSQWQSNYAPNRQSSDVQSCNVNLHGMPEIAFELNKIDANGVIRGAVTMQTQATVSWLLTISDEKRVDCDPDPYQKAFGSKRQAYMSLSYSSNSDANSAAQSLKALIRNSCSGTPEKSTVPQKNGPMTLEQFRVAYPEKMTWSDYAAYSNVHGWPAGNASSK
jgi:hypothetical protein